MRPGGWSCRRQGVPFKSAFPLPLPRTPSPPKAHTKNLTLPACHGSFPALFITRVIRAPVNVHGESFEMGGKTEFAETEGGSAGLLGSGRRLCPGCGSDKVWGNGRTRAGKRGWRCRECGRSFVEARHGIPHEVRTIADRMIQEEISPAVIAAILKGWVSRRWIYDRRKKNQATR